MHPAGACKKRILLIEDEPAMAWDIALELTRLQYKVRVVDNVTDGFDAVRFVDLVIMDRMLFSIDSLSIIEAMRKETIRIPVLVVSALASAGERVRGLRAGGDDYLIKPFEIEELVARVEALLRRSEGTGTTILQAGPLKMDLIGRIAYRGDRVLDLSPAEFRLLEFLMRNQRQHLSREILLEKVWHYRFLPDTKLVDVHIGKLRRKVDLAGDAPLIHNIPRRGFILDAGS
ncbi:MAG TPA: response regulator transcription factor [Methylocella sp.]|nr:response regulator transcription factor [Methylocella sp.]